MPNLSSSQSALRADGHSVRYYFGAFLGEEVFQATVDSTPTFPAIALTVTAVSGSASDVKQGFRVIVETAGGDFKGETHVRYSGTISSTNLPIREVSEADIDIAATDVVRVFNIVVLSDKLVEDSATFDPDGVTYSNQNSVVPPLACSGGAWIGFVDEGTAYATVLFDASNSATVDSGSAGTVTYDWSAPTASTGTTSTSATPSFVFAAGYHLVTLIVTDSSNSATWTQYIPVRVFNDSTDPPHECLLPSGLSGEEDGGWSTSVRLFENATLSDLPDRSLVCAFVRERINGAVQSFGSATSGRSHMKVLGYLHRDENRGDADNTEIVFEVVSPMQRLSELPGYSKVMISEASPDQWSEIQSLSVRRAIIQILRYYTTLAELFDLKSSITDLTYPRFYLQKQVPREQVKELADGIDARFTCDRTGHFQIHTAPPLVALASRSGITTTLTVTDADIIDFRFARNHFRVIEVLEARGFTNSDPQPIFSRYPGTPGFGAQEMTVERLIAASQTELNERCARRGAFNDGVFIDSNGVALMAVEAEIRLPGAYDVFDPAYQEYIVLSLGSATNRRGIDLSDFRFYVQGVTVDIGDSGTSTITLRLRSETNAPGSDAMTHVPGQPGDYNLPPITDPETEWPGELTLPPSTSPAILGGSNRIGLVLSDGTLARTTNFNTPDASGGPNWTIIPFTGETGTGIQWCVDASDPTSGWFVTTAEVGKLSSIDGTPGYSVQHTFGTATDWRAIDFSFGAGGPGLKGCIISHYSPGGTLALYTSDGGATWSGEATVTAHYDTSTGGFAQYPACFISSKVSGLVYTSAYTSTGPFADSELYKSTDGGATWTSLGSAALNAYISNDVHAPWHDNAGDALVYYGGSYQVGPLKYQLNSYNGSTHAQDLGPDDSTYLYGVALWLPARGLIKTLTTNRRIMLLSAGAFAPSQSNQGIWRTDNIDLGPSHWQQVTVAADGYTHVAFNDADLTGRSFYLYGPNGKIGYCGDGVTADDRTGDLVTSATVIGIFGY